MITYKCGKDCVLTDNGIIHTDNCMDNRKKIAALNNYSDSSYPVLDTTKQYTTDELVREFITSSCNEHFDELTIDEWIVEENEHFDELTIDEWIVEENEIIVYFKGGRQLWLELIDYQTFLFNKLNSKT